MIGAGALGNEVVKVLALLNVGKLFLCDQDVVSISNLNRCVFFRKSDVGRRAKVEAVAKRVAELPTSTEIAVFARPIQEAPRAVWDVDVVALCVDNDLARYFVNATLLSLPKPLPVVNGAMGRGFVEVSVLVPGVTACLCCLWEEEYAKEIIGRDVAGKCDEFFTQQVEAAPSLATLTTVAGGMIADQVVKAILPFDTAQEVTHNSSRSAVGRMLRLDLDRLEFTCGQVLINPKCVDAVCRRKQRRQQSG